MISEKLTLLIDKLKENTQSGILTWDRTSSDTEFYCSFKKGKITVSFWDTDEYGDASLKTTVLTIYNDDGNVIEHLSITNDNDMYITLYDLYYTVLRKYLKADETIDDIMKELEDDIPF